MRFSDELTKRIQDFIESREGYIISERTLKTDDLLGAVYNFICEQTPNNEEGDKVLVEIEKHFTDLPTSHNLYYGLTELKVEEDAEQLLNNEVYDFMNSLAPEGYYYGGCEGDGACIGFFRIEEEV